ncbi:MAG: hypothetical protein MZV65_17240 [Chromatiales bacterium]|nr:hypothetical protein [Chromatiales bacterium]
MSLPRFAMWGGAGGFVFSTLFVLVTGLEGARSWAWVRCSGWRARAAPPVRWPWPAWRMAERRSRAVRTRPGRSWQKTSGPGSRRQPTA